MGMLTLRTALLMVDIPFGHDICNGYILVSNRNLCNRSELINNVSCGIDRIGLIITIPKYFPLGINQIITLFYSHLQKIVSRFQRKRVKLEGNCAVVRGDDVVTAVTVNRVIVWIIW